MTPLGSEVELGLGDVCLSAVGPTRRPERIALLVALVGFVLVCVVAWLALPASADTGACPNEEFRTGASASLPDCRAYELVTPADKGRTQDLTFSNGNEEAVVAGDGEHLALTSTVPFGPNPSLAGARAIFSRTSAGWEMSSVVAPGASAHSVDMRLFSPELSQVAFESETGLNFAEVSEDLAFEVGPVGGPYALVAGIPREDETEFLGASADLEHVLFASVDHSLLLSGAERTVAEATDSGALDLYEWSSGQLHLVNITMSGLPFANLCGATLGAGGGHETKSTTVHAVSTDGSKIFFTIPGTTSTASGPGCEEPARLYMRANGDEPVEVSAPESGVTVAPAEIMPVRYNYATPNGSKVFFNTETALTSGDTSKANKLFEYDAEEPEGKRLRLVASGVPATNGIGLEFKKGFFFSKDGSTVYIESYNGVVQEIYRYDLGTGKRTLVAISQPPKGAHEPSFVTPNGEFLLFTSEGVQDEPRGAGSDELYRYDSASESVMCVSCGSGTAPEHGEVIAVNFLTLVTADETPALTPISESGQEVFFQTTARLVPQDTNSTETEEGSVRGHPGLDVYEWEADATGGCELVQGCTHLLSSGEASGPSTFLGASRDGSNVFFVTPARLVTQDTDEFDDIYDARVGGGFAPPRAATECLSCQNVGSPPPLFSPGASLTFAGAENPPLPGRPKPKHHKRHKHRPRSSGRRVKAGRAGSRGKRS